MSYKGRLARNYLDFHQAELDGAFFYQSDSDFGRGILGIISLREEIGYLYDIADWFPEDVADFEWDTYLSRLEWAWYNNT